MEPVTTEKKFDLKKLPEAGKKVLNWLKSIVKVKTIVALVLVLFLVQCIADGISQCTNYHMTPILYAAKISNLETYDIEQVGVKAWNGLGEKQLKKILDCAQQSDTYVEAMEEFQWLQKEYYADNVEACGADFHISVKERGRFPLDVSELREYRRELRSFVSEIGYLVDESEEYTSAQWRELADEVDMTKTDAKKLVQAYREYVEVMEPVQVTEGYEVVIETTITGEKLEEPIVGETEVTVLKVNGRWVMLDGLDAMEIFFELF